MIKSLVAEVAIKAVLAQLSLFGVGSLVGGAIRGR